MKKTLLRSLWVLAGLLLLLIPTSCGENKQPTPDEPETETQEERTFTGVNFFAANCMDLYYLWTDEISGALDNWLKNEITANPLDKILEVRYKQNGKEYDRWTDITDDYESMTSSVQGVSTTYGCDITLMMLDATNVCAVVTVVYPDSPAAKAGLKRGDIIVRINGMPMTTSDYYIMVTDNFLYSPMCNITLLDPKTGNLGKKISMTAVTMYENPVVYHTVFDIGGKKVGYLVFTSFTLRAIDDLLAVCEQFKADGVSELILDLRYNGGGYVTTEEALASMLAPEANVRAGDLFEQEVYNKELTSYFIKKGGADALKTFFQTSFSWGDGPIPSTCDTRSGHLDLNHLYAILDEGSASASESLLVGLMPYLDITLIGQQSHGKFCTGIMYGAEEWYDDYKDDMNTASYAYKKDVANWGLYVMIGRYTDCNGNCPAMPDGLKPDVEAEDMPELGYAFGDERDPMLRAALVLAGRTDLKTASTRAAEISALERTPRQIRKPSFGRRILTPGQPFERMQR